MKIVSIKHSGYTLYCRTTFGNYMRKEHLYKGDTFDRL